MTACVNKKHTRRVALAISASLVGALSLGAAAPAVAFAENSVETQAVDPGTSFSGGELVYAKDNNGYIYRGDDLMDAEFEYDGKAHYLVPEKFLPDGAEEQVSIDAAKVSYEKRVSGNWTVADPDTFSDIGEYKVVIQWNADETTGGHYSAGRIDIVFHIVGDSLEGTTIFNGALDGITDGTFTYTGEPQEVGFVLDGRRYDLDAAGNYVSPAGVQDFTVEYWDTATNTSLGNTAPTDAGSYTAVLTGTGRYAGSEEQIDFKVGKLNLADATIAISDAAYVTAAPGNSLVPVEAWVNGVKMGTADSTLALKNLVITQKGTSQNNGDSVIKNKDTYTVTVSATKDNPNVTGEKDVKFDVVDTVYTINYNVTGDQDTTVYVVADDKSTWFDFSKITTHPANGPMVTTVYDAEGNVVKNQQSINVIPGTYTVVTDIDGYANEYAAGCTKPLTITVKTRATAVQTKAQLWFRYQGRVYANTLPLTYDGGNFLDDITTLVKLADGTELKAGEDYEVTVTDQNRQPVSEIVNAGKYYVTVTSDEYAIDTAGDSNGGNTLVVDVHPMGVTVMLGSDDMKDFDSKGSFIPYDGSEHSYYFYYLYADGKEVRLLEGAVELDHFNYDDADEVSDDWEDVDAIKGEGDYTASVKVVDPNYAGYNVVTNEIAVKSTNVFSDVPSTHWGAEGIFDAYKLGYMSGYKGTTFFGPADHLSRAQAAVVLYNMGTNRSVDETNDAWNTWHEHGLAFPDAEQWYAVELGWASTLDIVKGYPTGMFGGSDEVTREQFAIMLRNYAAAKGEDVSVDDVDAALADVKDAGTVSDWAREAVAWAVENGVMGAEGYVYADQPIERAQAALMVTRYQPEKLTGSDLLTNGVR